MTFHYTEEQLELERSIKRFLEDTVGSEYLRHRIESKENSDPKFLNACRELGLFDYFADGNQDGGAHIVTLAIIARLAGRVLLPDPMSEWILAGPFLLGTLGQKDLLSDLFSVDECQELSSGVTRYGLIPLQSSTSIAVSSGGDQDVFNGTASFIAGISEAKRFVIAHASGVYITLDEIGSDTCSVVRHQELLDNSVSRSHVSFKDSSVQKLKVLSSDDLTALHRVLIASELYGIAARVVEMTVEYVSTRKQFDVPIGGFQAVQHKLADMHAKSEALRGVTHFAAWSAAYSPEQLELASRSALFQGLESVPLVVEKAIQLHGGIGFTWEHDLHLYLRRAQTLRALFAPDGEDHQRLLEAAES